MSLVSVIIPTFNRGAVLERALNSVAEQSYTNWELIVVDDGSSDDTENRWNEWQSQDQRYKGKQNLKYIKTTNQGVSRARNRGAQEARGSWLAFLDSDDQWLSKKLEQQMPLTTQFKWIHGEELWFRNGERVNQMKKHLKSGGRIFKRCVDLCCVSPSTVLIKKDLFDHFGGFDPDFPVCEDYALWLKLSAQHEIGFVAQPVINKFGGAADQLSTQFGAMDFYRAKALRFFLSSQEHLSEDEFLHLLTVLEIKCKILLKGYAKYNNELYQTLIQDWCIEILKIRTQFQSAHSAAERLPRSVDMLIR